MRKGLRVMVVAALSWIGCSSDVSLSPPKSGFQVVTGDFPVMKKGVALPDGGTSTGETQRCYFFDVPSDTPVYVSKFEIAQNPGTHHMNIFRVKTVIGLGGDAGDVVADGPCWTSSNWADWPLVVNSQESTAQSVNGLPAGHTEFNMPAGVAERFEPHELLMLQTHYVNATTQQTPAEGRVLVNFDEVDPSTVTAELGTLFATNQSIRICPGNTNKYFETTCGISQDAGVTITGANSHFHSRGVDFWMATQETDGGVDMPAFYDSKVWNEPPMAWGLNVPLAAGATIRYHCEYTVPQDTCGNPAPDAGCCFTFGGHVETQEHCNIFVYYYPKVSNVGCF